MNRFRVVGVMALALLLACVCVGQKNKKPQASSLGGLKGKVRVESGAAAEGISVVVRADEREVSRTTTDSSGRFEINNLAPGRYSITFRKQGLRTAELKDYEISPGKVRSLGDRVYLPVDEGSIAFLKGSVFTADGRSVEGAQVELARVLADGSAQKIDGRVTNDAGEFSFRLTPAAARYRVTARLGHAPPVAKEIEIEGAAVFRIALSLAQPAP
ncbi:MAG TPA: carboxypeptidase-like regulatory domain-containing protein [Pyrinomonadaceae bacterium]|nr:carboxypeptidase-like regulatory domain-containing protein [Pyrinomonadaceae bacterium]